ncbi:MAG: tRNA-dihydrouridine synthase family protein [Fretibacterium sp.]|nr:tRNA-dihydrouridine synthase family protein [Fretibacterium sp.]
MKTTYLLKSELLKGGLPLATPLWLAPLAGVTTPPFREFFTQLGASLTHTEMVSCAGLVRGNRRTLEMLQVLPTEAPVVLQLFTGEADLMVRGAEAALALTASGKAGPFAALGLNMACPMPKVTKRGAGAALLSSPETAFRMTREVRSLGLPVWVKMRRLAEDDRTMEFVEGLLRAGADNVCIHGRTAAQRYEGRADRQVVLDAARRFPEKISASGDVREFEDIREYLEGGCVGVMLARGALADPWLFPGALALLGCSVSPDLAAPSPAERFERLASLGERAKSLVGERQAVLMLKHLTFGLLRGINGAAELRCRAGCSKTLEELLKVFQVGALQSLEDKHVSASVEWKGEEMGRKGIS